MTGTSSFWSANDHSTFNLHHRYHYSPISTNLLSQASNFNEIPSVSCLGCAGTHHSLCTNPTTMLVFPHSIISHDVHETMFVLCLYVYQCKTLSYESAISKFAPAFRIQVETNRSALSAVHFTPYLDRSLISLYPWENNPTQKVATNEERSLSLMKDCHRQ